MENTYCRFYGQPIVFIVVYQNYLPPVLYSIVFILLYFLVLFKWISGYRWAAAGQNFRRLCINLTPYSCYICAIYLLFYWICFWTASAVQAEFSQGHNITNYDENEKMLSSAYFHVLCCAVATLLSLMLAYFTSFAFGISASARMGLVQNISFVHFIYIHCVCLIRFPSAYKCLTAPYV